MEGIELHDHEAVRERVAEFYREDAEILVGGQIRNLRRFVRENWSAMKEQPRLARTVVEAIERATGAAYRREAA